MLLRGRSKDRERKVSPPGPVYMSNEEFGEYLKNLRNNRISRPAGARPLPVSARTDLNRGFAETTPVEQILSSPDYDTIPRSASVLSQKRTSLSTYSSVTSRTGRQLAQQPLQTQETTLLRPSEVVPSATYIERGQRWMEKEEAVSLREAMEDMDLKKAEEEEARVHAAAQDEASELVWQHQHPESHTKPDAPYRYKDHLRKNSYQHARTQSVGRYGGIGIATGLARDIPPRSISGSSGSSGDMHSPPRRISSELIQDMNSDPVPRPLLNSNMDSEMSEQSRKSYGRIGSGSGASIGSRKKINTSVKRNISGEVSGTFTGEQIWEEPEQDNNHYEQLQASKNMPAPLRLRARNPLNRVQFSQELGQRPSSTPPEPIKRSTNNDIQKTPLSHFESLKYVANPVPSQNPDQILATKAEAQTVPMKDGLEIRSDEIRQATSMRLKDRSPKLPTPTVVSDKPGRPIVSFEKNWKPKEDDSKSEVRRRSPFDKRLNIRHRHSVPACTDSTPTPPVVLEAPVVEIRPTSASSIPTINIPDGPSSVPSISATESTTSVPTIIATGCSIPVPTIICPDSTTSVPTINFPNNSDVPAITVESDTPRAQPRRPLPIPKSTTSRIIPRQPQTSRGHWSPAAGKRATATCHQCQLPIEGRVVKLSGAMEHFHPECFICFCCGTGLESLEIHPEPSTKRAERIDRIKRRALGELLPDVEGQTAAEDGDERQRYYCHLDFHENFAPRCKHCKTPIIGEHTVALGEHWHYGHFFCAECGDPFEKGMTHIEKDGYAWCLNCQTNRTERQAPKCKKCKMPVIGEYVQALGGEWHEKCFRCATCKNGFEDGAFYPKQNGNEIVVLCIQCIERELKA